MVDEISNAKVVSNDVYVQNRLFSLPLGIIPGSLNVALVKLARTMIVRIPS